MSIIGSVVEFELAGKSAGDLTELYPAAIKRDITAIAKVLACLVTRLPPEWGDPKNPRTYLKGHYYTVVQPVWNALVAEVTKDVELPKEAEINFSTEEITGEQMGEIWHTAPLNFERQAKLLAQFTLAVAGVGKKSFDHKKAENWLALDHEVFRAAWIEFAKEINSKN